MRISDWSSDVCSSDLLLARAHVQELVETLGAERLLHGIDETDGELGMAVGEEAIRSRRQPPQLGRPTDRPRFGFVSDQALCLEIVEVLAPGHGGKAEAAGQAAGILLTVLLQADRKSVGTGRM